jgi:hypothetical protein
MRYFSIPLLLAAVVAGGMAHTSGDVTGYFFAAGFTIAAGYLITTKRLR